VTQFHNKAADEKLFKLNCGTQPILMANLECLTTK